MKSFIDFINEKCWKGYVQKGMKKKGRRTVPNCVKEEAEDKTTVAFHGKARIPHMGHKMVVDHAKSLAKKVGGSVHVNLSGASEPLSVKEKAQHASRLFGTEVHTDPHSSSFVGYLKHLHDTGTTHLHVVAGSDRVEQYKSILNKYNGKPDKKGKTSFNFKSWKVHGVGAERNEGLDKHPTKMSDSELSSSVSASRLERHAKEGDYPAFKAYHKGMKDGHVKSLYNKIRNAG